MRSQSVAVFSALAAAGASGGGTDDGGGLGGAAAGDDALYPRGPSAAWNGPGGSGSAGLAAAPDGGEDGFARLARERTETTAAQATLEGLLRWAGVPRAVDALYSSGAPAKSLEARCRILIALCRRLHAAL